MLLAFVLLANLVMIILGRHLICFAMSKASGWVTSIPLHYYRNAVIAGTASLLCLTNGYFVALSQLS